MKKSVTRLGIRGPNRVKFKQIATTNPQAISMINVSERSVNARTREYRGKIYDISPAHPLAALLPSLPDDELDALAESISQNKQYLPILRLRDGQIIDGRHRELACRIAGITPRYETIFDPEAKLPALVASLNLNRRHLDIDTRKELAIAILKAEPERSDRDIAKSVGLDHKSIAKNRRDLEAGGEIPHLDTRRGSDGKTYPSSPTDAPQYTHQDTTSDPTPLDLEDVRNAIQTLSRRVKKLIEGHPYFGPRFEAALQKYGIVVDTAEDVKISIEGSPVRCERDVVGIRVFDELLGAFELALHESAAGWKGV